MYAGKIVLIVVSLLLTLFVSSCSCPFRGGNSHRMCGKSAQVQAQYWSPVETNKMYGLEYRFGIREILDGGVISTVVEISNIGTNTVVLEGYRSEPYSDKQGRYSMMCWLRGRVYVNDKYAAEYPAFCGAEIQYMEIGPGEKVVDDESCLLYRASTADVEPLDKHLSVSFFIVRHDWRSKDLDGKKDNVITELRTRSVLLPAKKLTPRS